MWNINMYVNLHNCIELISVCDRRRFTRFNKISRSSEKSLGDDANRTYIARYEELIRTYKEYQEVLDENLAMAKQNDANSAVVTANDVLDLVKELYELELTGKDIKDFYDEQEEIRKAEIVTKTEKVYKQNILGRLIRRIKENLNDCLTNPSKKRKISNDS